MFLWVVDELLVEKMELLYLLASEFVYLTSVLSISRSPKQQPRCEQQNEETHTYTHTTHILHRTTIVHHGTKTKEDEALSAKAQRCHGQSTMGHKQQQQQQQQHK